MARLEIPLTLTPCQQQIESSPARFKLVRAGRKFGKTTYGLYSLIRNAGKSGSTVWYIAPTYRQAKTIAWRDLKRLIPKGVIDTKNEQDLTIDLVNKATIYLMGGDSPESLRGPSPNFVVMEEAAYHSEAVWTEIVRPALTAKQGATLFISTPRGMNWWYELHQQTRGMSDWEQFHFTVKDNPFIPPDEVEAARSLCKSDLLWRQEYLAEFEAVAGRVLANFSESRHVVALAPANDKDRVLCSIDWGQRDDTVATFMTVRDKNLCVLDLWNGKQLGASQMARGILNYAESRHIRIDSAVLSWDAWKMDTDRTGNTIAQRFINEFHPIGLQRSDKLRDVRIDMLMHLVDSNRLYINAIPQTRMLVDQILKLEWTETMGRLISGRDDAFDSLSYGAMRLSYELELDKLSNSVNLNAGTHSLGAGQHYLRGYPREAEEDATTAVFDEVTGYIGRTLL